MSLNVKCGSVIGLPMYGFLVVSNSNTWPKSAMFCSLWDISLRNLSDLGIDFQGDNTIRGLTLLPLQDIRLWNLSDLDFDISRSLKVKYDTVIGLPIYNFLLVFNSSIWPNSASLRDISCQNVSDLNIDLSTSLKSNVITSIYSPYMFYFSDAVHTLHWWIESLY